MIVFSGTSYLGLDTQPEFLCLVKEGLDLYGTHYGGSRLSPLCPNVFTAAETAFAKWVGAPSALLVGSGTAAGQLAARFLAQRPTPLHIGPLAHPALWWPQGIKHTSWDSLFTALNSEESIAFSDALDPLGIQQAPWQKLLSTQPSGLVIDDSHLIGCYGPQFTGSWQTLSKSPNTEVLITASLGKALALPAGILLGKKKTLDKIRTLPQFGGASPPSPAFLHAWLHGQAIIAQQQDQLQKHLSTLKPIIEKVASIRSLPGFPVYGLQHHQWRDQLEEKGIVISSFRYPDASSPLYSRIVVRADHTEEQIAYLGTCLQELAR